MNRYVYATQTCVFGYSGGTARIKRGQIWYSNNPIVREHPEFFSDEPVVVHGDEERTVEDTTAEPGKKRTRTK